MCINLRSLELKARGMGRFGDPYNDNFRTSPDTNDDGTPASTVRGRANWRRSSNYSNGGMVQGLYRYHDTFDNAPRRVGPRITSRGWQKYTNVRRGPRRTGPQRPAYSGR